MKEVKAWKDEKGVVHDNKRNCLVSDMEILIVKNSSWDKSRIQELVRFIFENESKIMAILTNYNMEEPIKKTYVEEIFQEETARGNYENE